MTISEKNMFHSLSTSRSTSSVNTSGWLRRQNSQYLQRYEQHTKQQQSYQRQTSNQPQGGGSVGNFGLQKSASANSVVLSGRGFKPSDRFDPGKREFLTNLSTKIWHVGGRDEDRPRPPPGITPGHIDFEKLFTPATDSGESTPCRRRMYASSSFYGPEHPTVEEQVELARRISHSLSDISNQRSKGQTMYVNRKKRSAKWVHEATDEHGRILLNTPHPDDGPVSKSDPFGKEKPVLKLVMDPRGQVQDLSSLRKQGIAVEPALSPEVCINLVRDLNAPKGKGAELFAKRRKKSEKWVVDETTVKTTMETSKMPLPVPAPSYLTNGTTKVQTVQRMNEIQEKFSQPRLRLVKSPWEAALETGSVDGAFQYNKVNGVAPKPAAPATPAATPVPPPRAQAPGTPTWTATTTALAPTAPPRAAPLSPNAALYQARAPRGWGQQQQQTYGGSALLNFRAPEEPAPLLLREAQGGPQQGPQAASQPANQVPAPPPRTVFMDYSLLQNYNTAPRGWGQSPDYYRPVTFSKPIAATDL